MLESAVDRRRIAPSASSASAVAALLADERTSDSRGVALPRPEIHLVVRFGSSVPNGLDVHALGPRQRVRRKLIRSGQRTVTARLHLGTHEAVLGAPAAALSERIVALEDLWGGAAARRLCDQLANARNTLDAAATLERAIASRLAAAPLRSANTRLALDAAERLSQGSVSAVAAELGVSERHLRRLFHETMGVNPKVYTQLSRFRRALRAARTDQRPSWASIASLAGYYDQAHLIAEFRAISGVTPRALLEELRTAMSVG